MKGGTAYRQQPGIRARPIAVLVARCEQLGTRGAIRERLLA